MRITRAPTSQMGIRQRCPSGWHAFRVQTASDKLEHGLDLLSCYLKLLDDLLYGRACLQVFKNRGDGHPGVFEHQAPLRLSATLSTAEHWDQSRVAMFVPLLSS